MNNNNSHNENPPAPLENFKTDFIRRVREIKKTRWIRFGIVTAIFLIWVAWLGNWWVILLLPLLFDIYITGYIPFTWWKKSENKTVRLVMSWVDAIVYALILLLGNVFSSLMVNGTNGILNFFYFLVGR